MGELKARVFFFRRQGRYHEVQNLTITVARYYSYKKYLAKNGGSLKPQEVPATVFSLSALLQLDATLSSPLTQLALALAIEKRKHFTRVTDSKK